MNAAVGNTMGRKRHCPDCGAKFYDLGADEVSCPKCGFELAAPSKTAEIIVDDVMPKVKKKVRAAAAEDELAELEEIGSVVELEELDDFDDDDIDHLEEVEDHHEDPEVDINSDDADDEMFIDEIAESDLHIIDEIDESEYDARESL